MKPHVSVVAIPALALLLLAGCIPGEPMAAPSSVPPSSAPISATATPTPTPSASPSASPVPIATRPSLEELILSFDGLGPLRLGDDPSMYDPATSIVELGEPGWCGDAPPLWEAVFPDRPFGNGFRAFDIRVRDVGIEAIIVVSPKVTTVEGLRVGAPLADMLAIYPTAEFVGTQAQQDRYVVRGEPGTLLLDVANGIGGEYGLVFAIGVQASELSIPSPSYSGVNGC